MSFSLDTSDKIRGDASVGAVVDYLAHGIVGTTVTQLADGQLAATITDIYTAGAAVAVLSITLVNTDTVARTVNLYLTPSGGTARRLIPKDLSLGAGYSLTFDGQKIQVMDTSGNILTSINLASPTFTGTVTISSLTASEIVATNASKALVSLAVATYPSLTELSYVKGVTSALQTQMNLKAPLISPSFTTPTLGAAVGTSLQLSGLTASEILGTDASKNLVSLAVATYPSLAELAYVKGVTSALQTQLGLKAPLASPTFTGTVTLPAVTLGGAVALGGNAFDAGAGTAEIDTTGNQVLLLKATKDDATGVYARSRHVSASPAINDEIYTWEAQANNSTPAIVGYARLQFIAAAVAAGAHSGKVSIQLADSGAEYNEALTLASTGVLAVDLAGVGTPAQVDLFDDYDDAIVLRQGIQQNNRELLADMGVLSRKNTGSGYMMALQPMIRLLAGGIYQTRQQLDDLRAELNGKLALMEKKLALLN